MTGILLHDCRFTTRTFFAVNRIAVILLAISTASIFAQNSASITGTVTDGVGGLLPDASITVRSETTTQHVTSDNHGHYTVIGLPAGKYSLEVMANGFAIVRRSDIVLAAGAETVDVKLPIASANDTVTVEATASGSIAAALAPMDGLLEATSARTEIGAAFIQNFTAPTADFSELIQMSPGAYSVASNGAGNNDAKSFFRGFSEGQYDVSYDGIPVNDTDDATHHSWAFFPSEWIGGIDFDRSPGSASSIGPAPFGGTINLMSRDMSPLRNLRGGVTYGSWNSLLTDVQLDSGNFGGRKKASNLFFDFNRQTTDGYQNGNSEVRNAGSAKYVWKISDKTSITGFTGILRLDVHAPRAKGPTRAQVAQFGYKYLLQQTDPTQANYGPYNYGQIPTDFDFIGIRTERSHGWIIDAKPYTFSYTTQRRYAVQPKAGAISLANCNPLASGVSPCGLSSKQHYRKFGSTANVSQVSRFGVFRAGMWFDFARSGKYQYGTNPLTHVDAVLPNSKERYDTFTVNPYAEYEWHPTSRLTLTGGAKYGHYTQNFLQFADNGSTATSIGNLGGAPSVQHTANYNSILPSAHANYRIRPNWTVYGQFATGSIDPPTSVFDVAGGNTKVLPKPTNAKTYQTGSVLKMKRVTLNLDAYYVRFQNTYAASTDPDSTSFTPSGDSVTKGFEGETNLYFGKGISFYANGTAGTAKYASQSLNGLALTNFGEWVANTPANSETMGLTLQRKGFDAAFFHKRVGPLWQDGSSAAGPTLNQVVPIDPFSVENVFVNYTVRGGKLLGTKLRFSVNNLLDAHNITSVTQLAKGQAYVPAAGDTLGILAGRSFSFTLTMGVHPKQ